MTQHLSTTCIDVYIEEKDRWLIPMEEGGGGVGAPGNGSGGSSNENAPTTFQYNSDPSIDLNEYFDCFNTISDNAATYSVKLSTFLPKGMSNPNALVNYTTFPPSPGHAFITLTKKNGNTSMSQSFGFYPSIDILSLTTANVGSKINDDGGRQYDASIVDSISSAQFSTIMTTAIYLGGHKNYNIIDYNCTDYAIEVFNKIRPANNKISVANWTSNGTNYGTTPNGLYKKLAEMKANGETGVQTGRSQAPGKHGACN